MQSNRFKLTDLRIIKNQLAWGSINLKVLPYSLSIQFSILEFKGKYSLLSENILPLRYNILRP
jgi:hypothetical protein